MKTPHVAALPGMTPLGFPEPRPLKRIAHDIARCWVNMYFGAKPYVLAMQYLDKVTDDYGSDDARSIVNYFLSNATSWRGEDARRIKAELKALLKTTR